MHEIVDVITRLDFLTQRAEDLARDIRILGNDIRRADYDNKI